MSYQPAYDITTVVRGPAHLYIDSGTAIWTTECTLTPEETLFGVPVAGFGDIDARRGDLVLRIAVSGAGNLTADVLSFLFGFGSLTIGSLMPQRTVYIKALNGEVYTITNAYLATPPDLTLGANTVAYGSFEIVGVVKNATSRETAAALLARASATFSDTPDPDTFPSLPVKATWNGASILHDAAWSVRLGFTVENKAPVDIGTIGAFLTGITATASCTPFGMSAAEVLDSLAIDGDASASGIGRSRPGYDLVLTQDNPGLTVTLRNAKLTASSLAFAAEGADRVGELTWTAYRGSASELFAVALTAASSAA